MTIRHLINNEFYALIARDFCAFVALFDLPTEVYNNGSVITIVVHKVSVDTDFGVFEKYFIR